MGFQLILTLVICFEYYSSFVFYLGRNLLIIKYQIRDSEMDEASSYTWKT
jgi:hypothetical protein